MGDSCLFTAVLFWMPFPPVMLLGPVAAWYLHGIRLDRRALLAGIGGSIAAIAGVGAVAVVAPLILRSFATQGTTQELAGALTMLAAFGSVFAVVLIALAVSAIRDLSPARRVHPRLDVARLVATLVVTVIGVVAAIVQTLRPASEAGEAFVFALVAALMGALFMLVAEPLRRRIRPPQSPPSAEGQAPDFDAGGSTDSAQR